MSDRRAPERVERLDRAIERIVRGRPALLLGEPELDELLHIATRLRTELPHDLPDPAFRAALGADLVSGKWGRRRSTSATRPHFPFAVAASAIAAVLVAAIAVGSLAIWSHRDDSRLPATKPAQSFIQATVEAFSPTLASAAVRVTAETPTARVDTALATVASTAAPPTSTSGAVATVASTSAATSTVAATAAVTPTAPASTPTITPITAASQTAALGSADPPQVNGTTVEMGPQPAASGGGGSPGSNLAIDVATALPDLGGSATVFYMGTPTDNMAAITLRAAQSLGIVGEVAEGPSVDSRHSELYVNSATGHFAMTPDTGAFSFVTTGYGEGPDAGLDQHGAAQKALDWLASVGYPLDTLGQPVVLAPGEGISQWRVLIAASALPSISLGRPSGVELWIEADGRISSGYGYWLTVQRQATAQLITASNAIEALKAGNGYWGGGDAARNGGTFHVESLSLGYVLTSNGRGNLIAQPVVVARGRFTMPDGNETPMTVYVQAARVGGG